MNRTRLHKKPRHHINEYATINIRIKEITIKEHDLGDNNTMIVYNQLIIIILGLVVKR